MMLQFAVINGYICVLDTSRWDLFYGFNRPLSKLYQTEFN